MQAGTGNRSWPSGDGEMVERIRDFDWAATPLGPIATWSHTLRTTVQTLLGGGFPAVVLWGPDLIQIYNDGYRQIMAKKHPAGLGQPTRECWPEVWYINAPIYERVCAGESLTFEDKLYPITRHGSLEDAWFTLAYGPVRDDEGAIAGVLVTVFETTARHRTEVDLRASEERSHHILEEATDYAIFTTDASGMIETWPAGAANVFGWSADVAIGQSMAITFTPEDRAAGVPEREFTAARDTGAAPDVRWHLRQDGRRVFIEGTSYGVRGPDGEFRGMLKIGQDVTERRQADAALRRSEERLQRIVNVGGVGVLTFDTSGKVLYANDTILDMLGYSRDEFTAISFTWRDLTAPEYAQESERQFRQIAQTGQIGPYEKEYLRKDGSRQWMMFVGADLGDGTIVKYAIDISDRKATEAALRASEARFRAVAHLVPDLLWSTDPAGFTTWCNRRWFDYTGQPEASVLGWGWLGMIHPDDRESSRERFRAAIAGGTPWLHEHRIRDADGAYRWFLVRVEPVRDEADAVTQWFGSATDIHDERTHRQALEARVLEATAELRTLSRRLMMVQEDERRHLARELHDEIGQMLTGLGLQLVAGKDLGEARRIVQELTEQVRQLSMDLRPSVLDTYGLLAALAWHIERYQVQTGIRVDLRHEGLERRLAAPVEITAYRVVQEALTNVARHSGAMFATVQLFAHDGTLAISVRDSGKGFDPAITRPSSGMGGMRERVELLGGGFDVDSAPGAGTLVMAELPLSREADAPGRGEDA